MTSILIPLYFTVPLLLYFCGALIIGIIALVKVIKLWKLKKNESKNLIIGIIIFISLFGFLYLIYKGEKERFSLIFVGPFLIVFLPFILSISTKKLKT